MKLFEISLTMRRNRTIVIVIAKFQIDPEVYIEVARHLLQIDTFVSEKLVYHMSSNLNHTINVKDGPTTYNRRQKYGSI